MRLLMQKNTSLERAWNFRESLGFFESTQALRVFHGASEGEGGLQCVAIDRFLDHYWVTFWEKKGFSDIQQVLPCILDFLEMKQARSVVTQLRPWKGAIQSSRVQRGQVPERLVVEEGPLKFWIQLENTHHPGLFLDHAPLRKWLMKHQGGHRVLNTFSYTASLSMAAAWGGASEVVNVDFSRPTLHWAKDNWELNAFQTQAKWVCEDVLSYFAQMKRRKEVFDTIILDPPSFSHGKKGRCLSMRDFVDLYQMALELLSEDGIFISSLHFTKMSQLKYEEELLMAAQKAEKNLMFLAPIYLPETFPVKLGSQSYLKGGIFKSSGKGSSKVKVSPDIGWGKIKR